MGNRITNKKSNADSLKVSNGGMAVMMSILALSASDLAETNWEKRFAVWIAEHDQYCYGLGAVGFDIGDIGWNRKHFEAEKRFVLKTIDMAIAEHRWNALSYYPPLVKPQLQHFKNLVNAFQETFIDSVNEWDVSETKDNLEKCAKHDIYIHADGCLICHDEPIRP